jgi:hypothetical protein
VVDAAAGEDRGELRTISVNIATSAGSHIHEHRVRRYERLLREGNILVIVNGEPLQSILAHRGRDETQPMELRAYTRAAENDVSIN